MTPKLLVLASALFALACSSSFPTTPTPLAEFSAIPAHAALVTPGNGNTVNGRGRGLVNESCLYCHTPEFFRGNE